MKNFELKELQQFDGKDGRPAYVVYGDKVYDVSKSKRWKNGFHMNRHHAGNDLTTDIQAAPHDPSVLERYPQIGTLKEEKGTEREIPPMLSRILERAPFFRRHPHPMTIHFPIVFTFATFGFTFLYLITGLKSFETTAFHCLGAAVFFTPVAILTGFYTWWLNYGARSISPVRKKQFLSFLLLAVEIVLFLWRWKDPTVLEALEWQSVVYCLLVLFMFLVVTMIGWLGASLTFPIEKSENKKP